MRVSIDVLLSAVQDSKQRFWWERISRSVPASGLFNAWPLAPQIGPFSASDFPNADQPRTSRAEMKTRMVPSRVAVYRPHPRRVCGYDTRVSTVHVDAKEQLKPKHSPCQAPSPEQLQSRRTSQEVRQEETCQREAEQPPPQHVEGRVIRRPESCNDRQNKSKDQKNQREHVLPPFKFSIRYAVAHQRSPRPVKPCGGHVSALRRYAAW